VDLAALQLIDAGVGVGDEAEQNLLDLRVLASAPVVGHPFEADVLAALPLRDAVRPGAERRPVVIGGAIDVSSVEDVLRQQSARELQRVGGVDLAVVDHGGERIGRVDGGDAIEAVGALRVVGRIVDGVDGELHIG
jgi:hypothetical protein